MKKVIVTKRQAESIERSREILSGDITELRHLTDIFDHDLHGLGIGIVLSALVNGYEVEKSPEEKVREYFENYSELYDKFDKDYDNGVMEGVLKTLNLLGITIEGINDKEESE